MEKLTLNDVRLKKPRKRNKENIRIWVDALRSGKFSQGKEYLTMQTRPRGRWRHCCLGVACAVSPYSSDEHKSIIVPFGTAQQTVMYDGHSADLPDDVIDWLGIRLGEDYILSRDPMGVVVRGPRKGEEMSLISLNDDEGWTFDMIADLIDRDWL